MIAYPESYLNDAMRNMGEMTEYAVEACGMDTDRLFRMFCISGFAREWERGNPRYIAGLSGTELCQRVLEKSGLAEDEWAEPLIRYETGAYYWSGWILAYLQWKTGDTFSKILHIMDGREILRLYSAMHTVSEERTVDLYLETVKKASAITRLQAYRRLMGLSQSQLAARADINVRTLQQYETRAKDLKKASSDKVMRLAQVLCCTPEMLLE